MSGARLFGATPWTWRGFWFPRHPRDARHARPVGPAEPAPPESAASAADRAAILAHVHGIFRAFLAADRAAIRRAHRDDWTGFLVGSRAIERGIAAYMRGADLSLASFRGTSYAILEYVLDFHGDLALLYYTARYEFRGPAGVPGALLLRSLDVYRREGGAWNQAGSHIAIAPPASAD
jgi:ketosteroid isomerase-like protein